MIPVTDNLITGAVALVLDGRHIRLRERRKDRERSKDDSRSELFQEYFLKTQIVRRGCVPQRYELIVPLFANGVNFFHVKKRQ
jgi:hypothetical protein